MTDPCSVSDNSIHFHLDSIFVGGRLRLESVSEVGMRRGINISKLAVAVGWVVFGFGAIFLCALTLVVCSSSPTGPVDTSSEFLPSQPGSTWIYRDSILNGFYIDTVVDSLTRYVTGTDGLTYAEFLESSSFFKSYNLKWQKYYYQRWGGDTICSYWDSIPIDSSPHVRALWVFPFDSGRMWIDTTWSFSRDTFTVVGVEKVYSPATDTQLAVHIHRQSNFLNDHRKLDYWFVRGVGVIRTEGYLGFLAPRKISQLIEYKRPSRRSIKPERTDVALSY